MITTIPPLQREKEITLTFSDVDGKNKKKYTFKNPLRVGTNLTPENERTLFYWFVEKWKCVYCHNDDTSWAESVAKRKCSFHRLGIIDGKYACCGRRMGANGCASCDHNRTTEKKTMKIPMFVAINIAKDIKDFEPFKIADYKDVNHNYFDSFLEVNLYSPEIFVKEE